MALAGETSRTVRVLGQGYNRVMARGWESKSVEEQQAAATLKAESKQRLTPEQAARTQQQEAIYLSRRRILQQLQSVQNPRHRQMLESALSELDARLARMG
ncbi:MAG TPA: hypothetical protein VK579_09590 [Terriglobales bacterium]|nr:hypothetical protein [Terriglobales bacterium]